MSASFYRKERKMTKQKDEFIEKVQTLKHEIKAIQKSISVLRKTGLGENIIYMLIQKAAPNIGGRGGYSPISVKVIKAIMHGIDSLYEVTFPEPE